MLDMTPNTFALHSGYGGDHEEHHTEVVSALSQQLCHFLYAAKFKMAGSKMRITNVGVMKVKDTEG